MSHEPSILNLGNQEKICNNLASLLLQLGQPERTFILQSGKLTESCNTLQVLSQSINCLKMMSIELQHRRVTLPPTELSQRQSNDGENADNVAIIEQDLAPADKGAAAWRLLAAAFVFEALLWGI